MSPFKIQLLLSPLQGAMGSWFCWEISDHLPILQQQKTISNLIPRALLSRSDI